MDLQKIRKAAQMANNYQERKQARINRYKELAEKNHLAATEKHEESRRMMAAIPMGATYFNRTP